MISVSLCGISIQRRRYAVIFKRRTWTALSAITLSLAANAAAAQAPAVGDTYVYRVVNAYNREPRGQISYQVDRVEQNRVTMSVSSQGPLVEPGRVEVYAADGNWMRHALDSHGSPLVIEFPAQAPAYAFPLTVGKRWSMRVPASVPQSGESRSVRVDAEVTGAERIRLPAGEFDTLKITRVIYAGDANFNATETRIRQTEWYAPALRRAVRSEVRSEHNNLSSRGFVLVRGNWDVYELQELRAANP